MQETVLKEAARISLYYVLSFLFTVGYQGYLKFSAMAEHKGNNATRKPFERYGHVKILAGDRSVGNFLEWMGPFLILFWLNAFLNGTYVYMGWVYVASRFLYPILAGLGGIKASGPRPLIFLATLPGYVVLIFYLVQLWKYL